jgi:toluene monooxygenase system ferredoxin subunit
VTVRDPAWHAVATLDDLWEGEMTPVTVDGRPIVLINVAGDIYAYDDRCPHSGTPLSKGILDGAILTCSAHEWVFDSRLGQGINPATACLRRVAVQVEGEVISVRPDCSCPEEEK